MNKRAASIIAFIVTAVAISLMLPRSGLFKYNYKLGESWRYDNLAAPFDFSINKTEKELNFDKAQLDKRYISIYRNDTITSQHALAELASDFDIEEFVYSDTLPQSKPTSIQLKGISTFQKLRKLYELGVYDSSVFFDAGSTDSVKGKPIRVINSGRLMMTTADNLYDKNEVVSALKQEFNDERIPAGIILENYVIPSIAYDENLNSVDKRNELSKISTTKGFVREGALIVRENQIVDPVTYNILESMHSNYVKLGRYKSPIQVYLGNLLFTSIILGMTYIFLFYFRKEFSRNFGNILFILVIYIFMSGISLAVSKSNTLSMYMIPFAIVPFYIVTFYDIRMSIFEYVSILFICSLFSPTPFDLFFINLFGGLAGIFILQNAYHRTKIFIATGGILVTCALCFISVSMLEVPDISQVRWGMLLWFVLNVVLLLALYQLIYFFEKIFGFVTSITLFELCDTNQPLLVELSQKAPGTFQHSMQVANLAETAAAAIGANTLLARTGALYHDIGKMENPLYFIENVPTEFNPHDALPPEESAEIIRAHVTDGVKLARKHNLPSVVVDFITSHHGDSLIYFFYHNYATIHSVDPDKSLFSYPGPLPVSKETSICMICDAVEAASRTLKEYSQESISTLVDKIIDTQMREGQFAKSLLSIAEINRIREVLVQKISNVYHSRLEYPEREVAKA